MRSAPPIAAMGSGPADPADAAEVGRWLAEQLARESDPHRIATVALASVGRFLGASRVAFGEVDEQLECIHVPVDWTDGEPSRTGRLPLAPDRLVAHHYAAGRTLTIDDAAAPTTDGAVRDHLMQAQIRSIIGVPLIEDGRLVALFTATSIRPRMWSEADVVLVTDVASRLRGALKHLTTLDRLRASEAQFRKLAENMPGLCWLAHPDGRAYWGNRAWYAFFGVTGTMDQALASVVHPDDQPRASELWANAIATGAGCEMQVRLRGRDGGFRPFLSSASPIHDAQGQVSSWCGVLVDLSEHVAHDRHQTFLRTLSDAVRDDTDAATILATTSELLIDEMGIGQVTYSEVTEDDTIFNVFLARPGRRFDEVPASFRFAERFDALLGHYRLGRTLVARSYDDDLPQLTGPVLEARRKVAMCASINVPLVKEGRLVAILSAVDPAPRDWTRDEVRLLEDLSDRVWASVSRARAEAALLERERHQAFLIGWSDAVRPEKSPRAILALTLDRLGAFLGASRINYGETDAAGTRFDVLHEWRADGTGSVLGYSFRFEALGEAMYAAHHSGEPVVMPDLEDSPLVDATNIAMYRGIGLGALLAIPMVRDGRLDATLSIQQDAPRHWTPGEIRLAREVTDRTVAVLERARAEEALLERERNQAFLISWSDRLRAETSPAAIMATTLGMVGEYLGATRATHAECDATGRRFTVLGEWRDGVSSIAGNSFSLDAVGASVDREWSAGEIVRYDDVAADPRIEATAAARYAETEIAAFVSIPLIENGRVRSALSVQSRTPRIWRDGEVQLLREVSERTWVALERARAEAVLRERDRSHAFLLAWSDALRDEATPRGMLAVTLDAIGRHFGAGRANYAEATESGDALCVLQEWRDGAVSVIGEQFPLAALGERVLADHLTGAPVIVADVTADPRFDDGNRPLYEAIGVRSFLSVPLIRRGAMVAVLSIQQDTPRHWRDAEIDLLRELAERTWAVLERALSEQRLAASEAQLAAFLENAPIAMHLKDGDGRYIRVNPEFARALGRSREELQGVHPSELFSPALALEIDKIERRALAGEVASVEIEIGEGADAASVLAIVFPVAASGGNVRTAGFTLDLTERKRVEAALTRSRETLYQTEKLSALGSLLAGVSHELNNPLSIVVAQAVMMEHQSRGTELAERAQKIRRAADRCARIVQTFLAMARQERPERRPVDLNAVVTAAHDLAAYGLRSDGIATERHLADDLPMIAADSDQIHQIVINLIVNAQQAMAEHGVADPVLTLRTARGEARGTLVVEVADTGPGIPEEARRRVFEPFFTTKPQGQGTGIGLSFSQGLAEAHGGTLELVPSARGACFRLTLPIDEASGEPAAILDTGPLVPPPARRALVVDDEPEIAEALADFLELEGFASDIAVGGEEAKQRLAHADYDLIVSDLRMPGTDGPDLYAWIAAEHPAHAARVAFTTGDTLGLAAARFLERVDRPVLEKPFTPDTVRRFLDDMDLA